MILFLRWLWETDHKRWNAGRVNQAQLWRKYFPHNTNITTIYSKIAYCKLHLNFFGKETANSVKSARCSNREGHALQVDLKEFLGDFSISETMVSVLACPSWAHLLVWPHSFSITSFLDCNLQCEMLCPCTYLCVCTWVWSYVYRSNCDSPGRLVDTLTCV